MSRQPSSDSRQPTASAGMPSLEPAIIVIFGITGDLAQRYLLPALYHLIKDGLLHDQTEIVGVSRRAVSTEQLFEQVELCVNEVDKVCDPVALQAMHSQTRMVQMDLDDGPAYAALLQTLNSIEDAAGVCMNRLYYLSIPPQVYQPIIALLGEHGLNASCQHGRAMTRLLVEKPFGFDLQSAEELINATTEAFGEEQVFRIDHYLAKETVQNILRFRFEHPALEAIWDHNHITSIEIGAGERIGIEGRALFYEPLGALRDFIQSHLLQILAIATMDQPSKLDSEQIHAAKQAVLEQVQPVPANQVAEATRRGQYEGYRREVDNNDSTTETFAAITVFINSPRWQKVPINIWTGKALAEKKTEVVINFRAQPGKVSDRLRFQIQPDEGIEFDAPTQQSDFASELQAAVVDFDQHSPGGHGHPSAYERVLVDAVRGDHTLFATGAEVLAAWRIVQPVLDEWAKSSADLLFYPIGSQPEDIK